MVYLSVFIKARIREYVRRTIVICIGFVVVAGVLDTVESNEKGRKILGNHEKSFVTNIDDRDSHDIYAESQAISGEREKKKMIREVSAYNSVPGQTDSAPCISADGSDICKRHKKGECIVASNAYPLNARLRIEDIGDCTVADRMHPKFAHRVDLFMDKDVRAAKIFGIKKLVIAELEDAGL